MSATESRKLAIFFPGIGYTKDRPLLHYSRKMAKKYGYEEICIEYHNLPFIVEKTEEEMLRAIEKAIPQVEEQLSKIDYSNVEEILLVGKSIGTALATKLCTDRHFDDTPVRIILYTPVEATFRFLSADTASYPAIASGTDTATETEPTSHIGAAPAISFIGTGDPWSDLDCIIEEAKKLDIPLFTYADANHSLETPNVCECVEILKHVMDVTEKFLLNNRSN